MKICFEGPSGVGKTTMSGLFSDQYTIIPEVNILFRNEINEGGYWYYEKQVERYRLSEQSINSIFDGDIFQPLWYNWTYNYPADYFPLNKVAGFYREAIQKGRIWFPDLYIIFHTTVENLRARKEGDKSRRRNNFEKHLKLVESQTRFFGFMKKRFPKQVEFVELDSADKAKNEVLSYIDNIDVNDRYDSLEILETMAEWLSNNYM